MSAVSSSLEIHRSLPLSRPFVWLGQGWADLLHHKSASLAYGAMVSALGALILAYDRNPMYIAGAVIAFMLAGPIITAGLCELSRARDHGETSDFQTSLQALRINRHSLLNFAEMLAAVALIWFVMVAATLYLQTGSFSPSIGSTVGGDVLRHISSGQLLAYSLSLGLLGLVVLALSVVTVPMIIARHESAGVAVRKSLEIVRSNILVMVVWAVLILALVIVGFATQLWAMVVIFPLLGHATWCAYQDLVERH